jgi:hypothetical protein
MHTRLRALSCGLIFALFGASTATFAQEARPLLLRPDEVLSGILDAPVLEVAHDALRVLLQHRHMGAGCVA